MQVNYLAVVAAAISSFLIGGLWYSVLFGRTWQALNGLSDEQLKASNKAVIFGGSFVLSLIAAFVFAMFLGPHPSLMLGVGAGFAAGLCWVAASFGINYLFALKPFKLFLIDGGYHTLQFTAIGTILGLWH
jgi:hypothetical protein